MKRRLVAGGLLLLAGLAACAGRPVRLIVVRSSLAQTVSLLGDTLYSLPLSGAEGPERAKNIDAARAAVARDSTDVNARLRLARSTADLGELREAVALYNRIAEVHFDNPRVFRERGEVLLRLRLLDRAIADLRQAGLLAIGRPPILEAESSLEGAGGFTTVQFRAFFYQGVALYCKGDHAAAYAVLAEAARVSQTTDDRARAILWLFFAARRLGDGREGANVLALVQEDWAQRSDLPELALLFAFKGLVASDSLRAWAQTRRDEEGTLYSYALAYSLMVRPDRTADAELWLLQAHSGTNWAAMAYLAAEADLARLRGIPRR